MRVLNQRQESLLQEERKLLNDLQRTLMRFEADSEDSLALSQSLQQLDELFLLVVVGEFNSGKSAFINALLGQPLLTEGVTPTTTQINILRYGPSQTKTTIDGGNLLWTYPLDFLSAISIVDTPGTNAVIREHETITSQFVPRSDLVLFITSADRPFTESERTFLSSIREWGKKVLIVINKIDILQTAEDLKQVEGFVRDNARQLLGTAPEIFPVSARAALRAKRGEPALWSQSRFEPLERYIQETLDETGRLRLKLLNPLGIGARLCGRYLEIIASRLTLLKADTDIIADVDSQLAVYREDMQRDFTFRMADIEKILLEMQQRGQEFFDETFRLARIFDLFSKSRIQQEFEHRVVADLPRRVEGKVGELIDWLVEADLRQWQRVNQHLAERRREHEGRIVGDPGTGHFQYDRERLFAAVGREAQRVVETYDKTREAKGIADGALATIAASVAVEAGAVGLGALITALATTAAADVTGILMAGSVAALGLFIIPARRRQGKEKMREKVAAMRQSLIQSLQGRFSEEIENSLRHINEAIAPYTRFVRAERGRLQETQKALEELRNSLDRLRVSLEEMQ